jgi:hypothetical protein
MIYRYSCTTLNYIISVVCKWKLSPDLWITIWTEKNTMLHDNYESLMNNYQTVSYLYIHIRNMINTKYKRQNNLNRHNKLSKKAEQQISISIDVKFYHKSYSVASFGIL